MYAKVPEHLRSPLLKELRKGRLRSAVKYYPVLVLIFSAIGMLAIFVKGHTIVYLIRHAVPSEVPDDKLMLIAVGFVVLVTAGLLVYFLRQQLQECDYQICLYCPKCDAVDRYDDRVCPVCRDMLTIKETFFSTTDKDELKLIERWGLRPCKAVSVLEGLAPGGAGPALMK